MSKKRKSQSYSGVVKLRSKKLASGKLSYYLDIRRGGHRNYEFLHLYSTGDRQADKEVLRLAQTIRAEREVEVQSLDRGVLTQALRDSGFVDYVEAVGRERGHKSWTAAAEHLRQYAGGGLRMLDVTPSVLDGFKRYLLERLSTDTSWLYFGKIQSALNQAVRDGILKSNPAAKVKAPKRQKPRPKFLSFDEMRALAAVDAPNHEVKRAYLFACYTGLAKCDVRVLASEQLADHGLGLAIEYSRGKTEEPTWVPLHPEALKLLGTPKESGLVFPELPSDRYIGTVLVRGHNGRE